MNIVPNIVTPRDLQRSYRQIFDATLASGEPTIVLNRKKPEVAIIPIELLEVIYDGLPTKETPPLSQSGVTGMWKNRAEMKDAAQWIKKLRGKRLKRIYETKSE